jgi:site-specific recombinase XerD
MNERKVFDRYLTEAEEKQLFDHVWKFRADEFAFRDFHWMVLLRQTGMRINNLAMFLVADAHAVLADPQHHFKLRDADSKKGHGYTVKFNRRAVKSLRELLKLHSMREDQILGSDHLIQSRQGGRGLSIRSFQNRMQQWVLSAGLPMQASPHWFRHTLAKRLLKHTTHSEPLQVVKAALGHTRLTSTEVYTQPDREEIDRAWEAAS